MKADVLACQCAIHITHLSSSNPASAVQSLWPQKYVNIADCLEPLTVDPSVSEIWANITLSRTVLYRLAWFAEKFGGGIQADHQFSEFMRILCVYIYIYTCVLYDADHDTANFAWYRLPLVAKCYSRTWVDKWNMGSVWSLESGQENGSATEERTCGETQQLAHIHTLLAAALY